MALSTGRRSFLIGLAALALGGSGCTADPRIGGIAPSSSTQPSPTSTGAVPEPSPTPTFAGAGEGAAGERALARAAAGIAARFDDDLDTNVRLVETIARAHLVHAEALVSADPTARAVPPSPTATPRRPKDDEATDALTTLARSERLTATAHRDRAVAATGFSALLWASMGVAAGAYADQLESLADDPSGDAVAPAKTPDRHALPLLSDTEAIQDLVRQQDAMIYGYQLAIGRLSGKPKDLALNRLQAVRSWRDVLISQLRTRAATVPVPAPAYVPSIDPTTAARAGQLLRRIESALLPYVGLWLAAAPQPNDRSAAYAALVATDAAARSWGAPLLTWPGWNG